MSRKTKTPRAAKTAPVKTAPAKTPRAAKTPMVAVTKTAATITVAALARELNISALAARNRMRRRFGTLDVARFQTRLVGRYFDRETRRQRNRRRLTQTAPRTNAGGIFGDYHANLMHHHRHLRCHHGLRYIRGML